MESTTENLMGDDLPSKDEIHNYQVTINVRTSPSYLTSEDGRCDGDEYDTLRKTLIGILKMGFHFEVKDLGKMEFVDEI